MSTVDLHAVLILIRERELKRGEILVLLYLLAQPNGAAYVMPEQMCAATGLSRASLYRALQGLRGQGVIEWFRGSAYRYGYARVLDDAVAAEEEADAGAWPADIEDLGLSPEAWASAVADVAAVMRGLDVTLTEESARRIARQAYRPFVLLALAARLIREFGSTALPFSDHLFATLRARLDAAWAQRKRA